jgi:hypothetical protein
LNHIVYNDGDSEDMDNDDMESNVVHIIETPASSAERNCKRAATTPRKVKQAPPNAVTPEPEIIDLTVGEAPRPERPDGQVSSSGQPTPDGPVSSTDKSNLERPISLARTDPVPDGPISSAQDLARNTVEEAENDIKIKIEGTCANLPPEEQERRKQVLEKWVKANTDPKTGDGRKVFRRGCHQQCMTQILGGSGMDPWPIVKEPPTNVFTGTPNRFIEKNHFYVAGNEAWNPFGPRFPGDNGLVNLWAFQSGVQEDAGIVQEEFHLFVQCSDKRHSRHWHGKLAKGGRMYVGVYRKAYPGDEMCSTIVTYESLGPESKKDIADYFRRRKNGLYSMSNVAQLHYDDARDLEGEEKWDKMNQNQKETAAMVEYVIAANFKMEVVPVVFVRYDEELYSALVGSKATTARTIANEIQLGTVSLEAETLGQYY